MSVLAATSAVNNELDKINTQPDDIPDSELRCRGHLELGKSSLDDDYFEEDEEATAKAMAAAGLRSSLGERPQKIPKFQDEVLLTLFDILQETKLLSFVGSLATQGDLKCAERFDLLRPWLRKFIACCNVEEGFLSPSQALGCLVGAKKNWANAVRHHLKLAREATSVSMQNRSRLANFASSTKLMVQTANNSAASDKDGTLWNLIWVIDHMIRRSLAPPPPSPSSGKSEGAPPPLFHLFHLPTRSPKLLPFRLPQARP